MLRGGCGAFGSVVGQTADVACAQLAVDLGEGEANAVAVGQRRGWVDLKFGQRDAGCFEQPAKLSGFISELCRVGEMLELASAARAEVRAGGNRLCLRGCGSGCRYGDSWDSRFHELIQVRLSAFCRLAMRREV